MHIDETKIVAIYGALVATFTLGWNVFRDLHDRARVRLSAMVGHSVKNAIVAHAFAAEQWPDTFNGLSPSLFLTMTNIGRRTVILQGWAIRTDRRRTGKENFTYPLDVLPLTLKEGEYAVEHTDDLSLLIDGATKIYAWDTHGKKWSLPWREFRKLRSEVRNMKKQK